MFLLFVHVLCSVLLQLGAQQPDVEEPSFPSASVYAASDSFGDVTVAVVLDDFPNGKADAILKSVPTALRCNWKPHDSGEDYVDGTCKNSLEADKVLPQATTWNNITVTASTSAKLSLAGLVTALQQQGAAMVTVNVTLPYRTPVEVPAGWQRGVGRNSRSIYFVATKPGQSPPDLTFPVMVHTSPTQLLIPMLIVLFVPGLLAYWIQMRAHGASDNQKVNWVVWLSWINLASWLYWMTAVRGPELSDFAERLGITNFVMVLAFGVVVYAAPPLLAIAACFTAMAPLLSSSPESFQYLLRRQLTAEAAMLIPLGIFLTGAGMRGAGAGIPVAALVLAYVVYRGLAWVNWSLNQGESVALEAGPLFERAVALARKAGVTLARVSLIRTRVPEEANAFATTGDEIGLTESLVKGLTPRELDAVIAHELGHHKSGHLRVDTSNILLWVYILFAGPLLGWVMARLNAPPWTVTLPIAPLLFIMAQGLLSQRREYAADAGAVEITGDAEGTIAALGRLAKLSRIPVQSGGMMDSILSHPSMETRVLTLARRYGVADERALAIVRNPDHAYSEPPLQAMDTLPEPEPVATKDTTAALSVRERVNFLEQLNWLNMIVPIVTMTLIVLSLSSWLLSAWMLPGGLVIAIAVFVLNLKAEVWWSAHFATRLRQRLAQKLNPPAEAIFTGIHPGYGVICTDLIYDWDYGFLTLEGDWLCYRGDKASFAVPRQDIVSVSVVKGQITWLRECRVQVAYRGGAFTLSTDFARPGKVAERTAQGLRRWVADAIRHRPMGPPPEHGPEFPPLPGLETNRFSSLLTALFEGFKMFLASIAVFMIGSRYSPALAVLVLYVPILAFLRMAPGIIWPVRRPPQPVEPISPWEQPALKVVDEEVKEPETISSR